MYLNGGISIHLNEEIVNFFNSMTISKWRPYDFFTEAYIMIISVRLEYIA
jgi:hypothetical protein